MTQSFKTKRLVESALMIALSTILSFIIIFRLPFGGSITACCMLPVILAAYRYGTKWGLVTAFAFSLIQGIQGIAEGTFSAASLGVENGVFNGGFFSGSPLLAMIGLAVTSVLVVKNVRGALLIGILITTVIGIPMGITNYGGLVSAPHSIAPIFCKFEWSQIWSLDMVVVIFTFLFIDMFDTIGTLVGVCTKADMLDANGRIPRVKQAFMADALATVAGACFGTSTTTTYVESAAGVAQGGRSGLTSFVVACCFFVALFFSPLFLAIPSAATAPVLIIVGLFMLSPIRNIPLDDYAESIPAFICIIMMPLAYSISDGILLGMISYVVINVLCGNFKRLSVTMYVLAVLFILKYIFI